MAQTLREKYDEFISTNELTKDSFKDLVRMCGYAPIESQLEESVLPKCFEEFEAMVSQYEKSYTKEELYNQLCALNSSETISVDELTRILQTGDKLNDEEMDIVFSNLNIVDGMISIREMVDMITGE
ncbi:Myosin regulatory light chain cdc4 [Astathelohania contejeani]|uniref:Myosin regulatory light chain cdc4 n=1 Tax=Astathelohania contejeani TaxID=164912 RepID=A0ABQ7HZG9_9MICR|nr:Myosin regulatory light chain cdc4 [Thelohania contejeani]